MRQQRPQASVPRLRRPVASMSATVARNLASTCGRGQSGREASWPRGAHASGAAMAVAIRPLCFRTLRCRQRAGALSACSPSRTRCSCRTPPHGHHPRRRMGRSTGRTAPSRDAAAPSCATWTQGIAAWARIGRVGLQRGCTGLQPTCMRCCSLRSTCTALIVLQARTSVRGWRRSPRRTAAPGL